MSFNFFQLNIKIDKRFVFLIILIFYFIPSYSQATIYSPGETLEPDCAPGSANCGVVTPNSSASQTGLLSSTDWTTFNNKLSKTLNTGKIFIGDGSNEATAVTISGDASLANSGALTIADNAITTAKISDSNVTLAKIQDIGASKLLGNSTASSAVAEEIGVGAGLTFSGTDLLINSPTCTSNQRLSWNGSAFECKAGGVFSEIVTTGYFLLGPTSGDPGNPSFRAVTASDLGSGTANNQAVLLGNLSWFDLLDGSGKIESALLPSSITGSLKYKGTWNANTNNPELSASAGGGVDGDFYVVDTAGTTSLDGNAVWNVGDWIINNGSTWDRVEQGATVSSVNGSTGAVTLTTDNINEGSSNKYFSASLARAALSSTTPIDFNSTTGLISCPTCVVNTGNGNITQGTGLSISGSASNRLIGSGDVTFTLANTTVTANTYGANTSVPIFTVDAQGRLTSASTTTLDTSVLSSGNLSVARGGTGAGTFTVNGLLYGNGTSAIQAAAAGTSGQFLVANGSGVPTFVSASGDVGIDSSGAVTIGSGAVTSAKIADGTIANGDISGSAAISYSKLNLTGSIVNADITDGTIANAKLANSSVGLTLSSTGSDITLSSATVSLGDSLTVTVPNAGASARGVVSTTTQTFAGAKTFSDQVSVTGSTTMSGSFVTPRGSDYVTTGTQNDVNLGTGSYFHYTGSGNATFTGIAGGIDGRLIRILNDTEDYTLTIKNKDTNSVAASRIETPSGEDLVIQPEMMIALIYESDSAVWHIASYPATSNTIKGFGYITGGNAFAATASLGTTDAYGLNLITGGNTRFGIASNASTLTGSGATTLTTDNTLALSSAAGSALTVTSGTTGALTMDSGSTGAINIGTSANAKTITIGNDTGATGVVLKGGSAGITLNGDVTISDGHTFTSGTGIFTTNAAAITLAGNSSVMDMTGTGILGLNTTTNRAITTGSGMFTTGGDLTISGDDLFMNTNTSGAILVADGTNFNPVVLSGDASVATNGVLTINYSTAQSADASNKGFLTFTDWNTFNNKQAALGYTAENSANKSTSVVTDGTSDTKYPSVKAVKTYVDNAATGLNWQQPVELINVIAATSTPVTSPTHLDGYIINTDGATGDWSGFAVGDLIQYQTDTWVKIKSLAVGDRFGVAFKSNTTPSGDLTGYKNYKVQISGGSTGAFTYTFTAPANNDALFVQNTNAYYHNVSFTYSSNLTAWVQLSASVDWEMGSGLQASGSTISLGPLTTNWAQTGAFDINTNGNININNSKALTVTGSSTLTGNVVYPKGTDYSSTGTQNNVNFGAGSLFNYTGSDNATFTGFAGGQDGRFIRVINASSYTITLAHQNTGSSASNRMIIETGGNVNILPDSSFELSYDSGVSRWRVVVLPANTALIQGGNAYTAEITFGTTDTYGLNFITNNTNRFTIATTSSTLIGSGATAINSGSTLTLASAGGSALTVTASTTGALNLDSGTTGAVNLGTGAYAKTVTIGNTTGATGINLNSGTNGILLVGSTTISGGATFTTGSGITTINSTAVNLAGNSTVIDMTGSGTLGLNTTTNRAITTGTGLFTTGGSLTITSTTTASGALVASGNLVTPRGTSYSTTGTQNDVDLGNGSVINYTGAGTATFTGFIGGVDGRQVRIVNDSSNSSAITLNHEDSGSVASNRLLISSGVPISISKNGSVTILYDSSISRWRLVQIPASSAIIGAFAHLQNGNAYGATSVVGTTDAYGLNFITSGSTRFGIASNAATLTGTGATTITSDNTMSVTSAAGSALNVTSGTTGALTLDSGSTGAINIGTSANAKTITIGNGTGLSSLVFNAGTGNIDIGANAIARTINIGTGAAVIETINVGGTGANVISIGNTQTGGSVSVGTAMTTGTISIGGTGAQTGQMDIAPGTGAQTVAVANSTGAKTINIGNGVSGNTIAIGNGNNTSAQTINIGAGATGANSTVNILTGVATAGTQTLNLGTGASAKTVNIGNTTGASAVTIDSGTGAISVGTGAQARTINIGTGAAVQAVTLGSTNGASSLTLEAGTGALNVGTGAFAKTITLGNATGATAVNVNSGTGGIALLTGTTGTVSITSGTTGSVTLDSGTTGTVNVGTGNNAKTINIGTGTAGNTINIASDNTTADTVTMGTALDTININSGTVEFNNIPTAAAGNVSVCINSGTRIIRLGGSATSCNTSSLRFKHDVNDLDMGLQTLNELRPVNYYYNDNNTFHNGLIAEEVYRVIPTAVVLDGEGLPYALDMNEITPVIIKSIKEISVSLGDVSNEFASTSEGLTSLVSTIQTENAKNPIVIFGNKISEGKQFLTDLVTARVTAIRGYFDEIFTKKLHAEKICLKKANNEEICFDGDQIQGLIEEKPSSGINYIAEPITDPNIKPSVKPVIQNDDDQKGSDIATSSVDTSTTTIGVQVKENSGGNSPEAVLSEPNSSTASSGGNSSTGQTTEPSSSPSPSTSPGASENVQGSASIEGQTSISQVEADNSSVVNSDQSTSDDSPTESSPAPVENNN